MASLIEFVPLLSLCILDPVQELTHYFRWLNARETYPQCTEAASLVSFALSHPFVICHKLNMTLYCASITTVHAFPFRVASISHRATQRCYSVAERCIPARCAALLQRWQLSLQRCKRYTKSCELQRCATLWWKLYNVAKRYPTLYNVVTPLPNVVQRCNKAVRCFIKDVQCFKLSNAAIAQRCATLPNVIQRSATL